MERYIVSARKYRPITFQSVVGQESITQTLRNAINQNHLAQAYLFCGPRGVGKTTCARIFAKTINCLNPTADHDACNECESCKAFNEQRSFNIHELDAASNNSVDDIRNIIEQVRIPPQIGKYSVYIIDEVHMLSKDAFNALLKTLEEPPSYCIFILATTEKHKVLATILSRCQIFDFSRITVADTIHHLQYVASQEGITASEEALNVVAQKADGGMRDALSIFDQLVSFCGSNITYEQTIEVLNVLDTEYYFRLVQCALQNDYVQALLLFNNVLNKGFDAQNFLVGIGSHLRDVLVSKDPETVRLLETSDSIRQHYQEQAAQCPVKFIFKALDLINQADINYRTAKNKRLTIEILLLKLCQLTAPQDAPAPTAGLQPIAPHATTPQTAPQAVPQPAAAPVVSTVTAPPVSAPRPAMPAPPVPSIGRPQTIGRPQPMPSLSNLRNNPAQPVSQPAASTVVTPPPIREDRNVPFTREAFEQTWITLPRLFTKDDRIKATLMNAQVKLQEPATVTITVANPLQEQEIQRVKNQIKQELANQLQNDHIEIKTAIQEIVNSSAFTAAERYTHLSQRNPQLEELKTNLDLMLE